MKKIFLPLFIGLSLLLTACNEAVAPVAASALDAPQTRPDIVIAEGRLLPAPAASLAFLQTGTVSEILVKPGDQLAAGATIARLSGSEAVHAEMAAAHLNATLARQELERLQREALLTSAQAEEVYRQAEKAYDTSASRWNLGSKNEITDLELCLDEYIKTEKEFRWLRTELDGLLGRQENDRKRQTAQTDFQNKQGLLNTAYMNLQNAMAENGQSFDQTRIDLLLAIADLEIARQKLARLDSNIDPEQKATAEARLTAAESHLAAAEEALANFELRAPFAGTVLSLGDLDVGDKTSPGVPVAFVGDTRSWQVETSDLAEIDVPRISLGQTVVIQLDAFPDEDFSGKVIALDPVGRLHLGDMTYKVTIELDRADPRFLWNMTAVVNIVAK